MCVCVLTFFRQIELLKLGSLLVELHLQLLLELEDLSPFVLKLSHSLLENPYKDGQTHTHQLLHYKYN